MVKVFRLSFLVLIVSALYHPNLSYAGIEGDVYRVSYECQDIKGNPRWHATAEIRHKEGDIYNITERMSGIYSGFEGKISWVAQADFVRTADTARQLNMDQQIFDESGALIVINKQDFNYEDHIVTCTHEDVLSGTVKTREFKFSKDIINRLLQGVYVQKFIEKGETSRRMQVISPEPAMYNVRLELEGEEEIEVNGRTRKAYRLYFDPMLGLLNIVKIFLPRSYVWHSAEPIYEWLVYEGLESGVKSPVVRIISLEADAPKSLPDLSVPVGEVRDDTNG